MASFILEVEGLKSRHARLFLALRDNIHASIRNEYNLESTERSAKSNVLSKTLVKSIDADRHDAAETKRR